MFYIKKQFPLKFIKPRIHSKIIFNFAMKFMTKNICFLIAVKIGRVTTSTAILQRK